MWPSPGKILRARVEALHLREAHHRVALAGGEMERRGHGSDDAGDVDADDIVDAGIGGQAKAAAVFDHPACRHRVAGIDHAFEAGDEKVALRRLAARGEPAHRRTRQLAGARDLRLAPDELHAERGYLAHVDAEPAARQRHRHHPAHRMTEDDHRLMRGEQPRDIGGVRPKAVGRGMARAAMATEIGRHPASRPACGDERQQPPP